MALPPGLAGFVTAQQQNQQQDANQMQTLQSVIGLQGLMEQRQQRADEMARIGRVRELAMSDPRVAKDPLLGAIAQTKPEALLDHLMPKPKDRLPISVTGGYLIPGTDGQYTFNKTAEAKPDAPSSLTKLMRERDALPPDHPSRPMYDAAISKLTTHAAAPSATVVMPRQETKFQEKVGSEMGEQYSNLLKADLAAPYTISKYQRLGQLLDSVNTGKFTGVTTDLKAYAKGLGVDLNALGVADNVAPAQAAKAISNMLALDLRNPAGGAGMPGALSDKDREFLVASVPNLNNDPQGNEKLIDYRIRLAKREQMVARMARDYRRKNGRFDEGFYDQLKEWSDKNSLFPESGSAPSVPAGRKPLSAFGKGG